MASNAPGACCTKGVIHKGDPVGEHKELDGSKLECSSTLKLDGVY